MKLLLKNHLENARDALRANRMRTGISVLGIMIGVASITAILSLTSGASELLNSQSSKTRDTIAVVRSGGSSSSNAILADLQNLAITNTLTRKDAADIAKLPGLMAAPMALLHSNLKASDTVINAKDATLIGSTGAIKDIANLEVREGQFIDEAKGVVMGYQLSIDLFGTENALGNVFYVRNQPLTVIGVLKPLNNPINYLGLDIDNSAIMPVETLQQFTQNAAQIQQIVVSSDRDDGLKTAVSDIEALVKKNHSGDQDFRIISGERLMASSSRLLEAVSTTAAIIAGISLLVGSVGIMNIMLVNVAERQREVGIRKALGATNMTIVNQFLIESTIIGFIGGTLGYLLGMIAAFLLSMYLPFDPVLDWQILTLGIGIAVALGIISGIYPAVRAARKNPIEVLHY